MKIVRMPDDVLCLKLHLGEGEYKGKKVLLSISGGQLIVEYEKTSWKVDISSIVEDVMKEYERG